MKNFLSVNDVENISQLVNEAIELKRSPLKFQSLGKNKRLAIILFNPSLRTRLSTQIAAENLGMNSIVINALTDSWMIEFSDEAVMNQNKIEHIKDAARVLGKYFDIIAVRSFPSLTNRDEDYSELVLNQFKKYCGVPIISLESATRHPLQSFADLITIKENQKTKNPKIVLTWASHIKALPQAVSNSFCEWILKSNLDLSIAHPKGYELGEEFTQGAKIFHNQNEAIADADFIYVKNWSSFNDYGKILSTDSDWMLNEKKLLNAPNAKIMHCLPVRRNLELSDEILDGTRSLVTLQAENRIYSAQIVLKNILENV